MKAAGSRAVMARRIAAEAALDPGLVPVGFDEARWRRIEFFPTPPWATRALFRHVLPPLGVRRIDTAWECASGMGHMSRVLAEHISLVHTSDPYFPADADCDFLDDEATAPFLARLAHIDATPGWVITNPPFALGCDFALAALRRRMSVALLLRLQFLEGARRFEDLFRPHRPDLVAVFCERVPMCLGGYDPDLSSATAYAWFVWQRPWGVAKSFRTLIIPPCRDELWRPGDRDLAALAAPGWVPPSRLAKSGAGQASLALASGNPGVASPALLSP